MDKLVDAIFNFVVTVDKNHCTKLVVYSDSATMFYLKILFVKVFRFLRKIVKRYRKDLTKSCGNKNHIHYEHLGEF